MKEKYFIIGGALAFGFLILFLSVGPNITGFFTSSNEEDLFKIPLSEISKTAEYYTVNIDGTDIEFFVVIDSNDEIKVAFNACDVCYGAKKGYRQEGESMVCNNCGNTYPITGLGTENLQGGGCWPGYLPSKVEGDFIVLKKSDIGEGKYRFE